MNWFLKKTDAFPGKTAFIEKGRNYTYHDFKEQILAYEKLMTDYDIQQGQVIGLISGTSFRSVSLFFALLKKNNIIMPVDKDNEKDIYNNLEIICPEFIIEINHDQPKFIPQKNNKNQHPLIKKLKKSNSAGLILFSSGTSGKPKIVLHNLGNLFDSFKNQKIKDINSMLILGIDHIAGLDTVFRLLSAGATLTIPAESDPETVCDFIEKYKVNVLPASPTFLNLIILSGASKNHDLSSLRIIAFGSESMSGSLLQRLKQSFPGVQFQQKFGTSETSAIKILNDSSDELYFKLDDASAEIKIVDNELWIKSRNSMIGYLNEPVNPFENGWFKTGDLVEVKENGFIRITGRKKSMINVGGEKVVPGEVEDVLMEIDNILDCRVSGEDNLITGQAVLAEVMASKKSDISTLKQEIRKHCLERLPAFKVPVKIKFVEEIPHSYRFKKNRPDGKN